MTTEALQTYLHTHIPLSAAMGVQVLKASPVHVRLTAPLAPNLNMHRTVFGGSGATLALLAAWSLLHLRLEAEGIISQLVIHRSTMDYLLPIHADFVATASLEAIDLSDFFKMYRRKGRARLPLSASLMSGEDVAGRFVGEFVAVSGA